MCFPQKKIWFELSIYIYHLHFMHTGTLHFISKPSSIPLWEIQKWWWLCLPQFCLLSLYMVRHPNSIWQHRKLRVIVKWGFRLGEILPRGIYCNPFRQFFHYTWNRFCITCWFSTLYLFEFWLVLLEDVEILVHSTDLFVELALVFGIKCAHTHTCVHNLISFIKEFFQIKNFHNLISLKVVLRDLACGKVNGKVPSPFGQWQFIDMDSMCWGRC